MDPRERAEAILARARARGAYVVTPDSATSPMDASATIQIPRVVISAADEAERTTVFPAHRPEDELPAIAQEAATQSLASPGRPRPRDPQPEPVEGLVPTVKHPQADRSRLSRRLDGS